jgi:L-ascorbate metabolism protein UlaG (beta-lactamase superfamily)
MTRLRLQRVVHSSVLIQFDDHAILTDPWFSQRYGHQWGEPQGIALADLPKLTGVLSSHKDYDHFDMKAFASYPDKQVPLLVRKGSEKIATDVGFTEVKGLEPWQTAQLGPIKVTSTPAKHKEELGVPQNTYVLEYQDKTIFFGGDTLLIPEFKEVAKRFPKIDVALLPINGLTIRPLGNKRVVMNAEDAATLTAWLQPKIVVPIHYRYKPAWYRRPLIRFERNPEFFVQAVKEYAPKTEVRVLSTGEMLELNPPFPNNFNQPSSIENRSLQTCPLSKYDSVSLEAHPHPIGRNT